MKANEASLLTIIQKRAQFIIPIYQRTYSWQYKQCKKLFEDILKASESQGHFVGSIVYFEPDIHTATEIQKYLVIDGQQRVTTVTLLIAGLVRFIEENPDCQIDTTSEKLRNYYLCNPAEKDTNLYLKLLLTKKDKETLENLVTNKPLPHERSNKIVENYDYFYKQINNNNIKKIYQGLQKLLVIDVALEKGKDNPQLIFESLNSTGLDLSQADLIRNYILMRQENTFQKYLYEKYWYPMEQSFGEEIDKLPWFMRDYLTMKLHNIPKTEEVYDKFKAYFHSKKDAGIETIVRNLYEYSQYYIAIVLGKEKDTTLQSLFREITTLRMETSYPFLLAVYKDYEDKVITLHEFIEIAHLAKNYVFRRAICGIPTNSLNKTFAIFYKSIKKDTYLESVKATFLLMEGYKRFPNDAEFTREFQVKDIYNFRSRNYLLKSLENFKRKELVNAENYTIEHIIPQNKEISQAWQQELGENWKIVREKYLHTLGNITLTAYNSELSDRPFIDKKNIKGGFNESPLFLNKSVRKAEVWNEKAINNRAEELSQRALQVWP